MMDKLFDDYFRLFSLREGKVVLGRHWSTLWLLSAVLTVTFLAIAFSNASMKYLSDKMNDPFIRWMDIPNQSEGDVDGLASALSDPENMARFDYNGFQSDYYWAVMFFGSNPQTLQFFRGRFFQDIQTDLMSAILDQDNLVDGCCIDDFAALPDDYAGVILTKDALNRLGYEKAPAYIEIQGYSPGADTLFFQVTQDGFARIPLPVTAVVRRLPSNVDFVAPQFLRQQLDNDNTYPFNLSANPEYARSLHYFVPASVDYEAFKESLRETGKQVMTVAPFLDEFSFYKPELTSWQPGDYVSLVGTVNQLIPSEVAAVDARMMEKWGGSGVKRLYDFNFSAYDIHEKAYLSVYFNSLTYVRDFESFVNDDYHIKVDMSQVNAKENFNAVSVLANILSWAIVVFAITCIILFIVLRLIRLFRNGNREQLFRYLRNILCALCVYFTAQLVINLFISILTPGGTEVNTAVFIHGLLSLITVIVPLLLDILVALRMLALLETAATEEQEGLTEAAEKLSRLSCITLAVTSGLTALLYIAQILLLPQLSNVSTEVRLPITDLFFVLVILLLSRLLIENKQLRDDNSLFI